MKNWTIWSWTVAILPILAILLLALVGSVRAVDGQVFVQSKANAAVDFNGCTDSPTNPNPVAVRNLTLSPTASTTTGNTIIVVAMSHYQVSLAGCVVSNATEVRTVTDTGGSVYSRLGGTTQTCGGCDPFSFEVWKTSAAVASSVITVRYWTGNLRVNAAMQEWSGVTSVTLGSFTNSANANGTVYFSYNWTTTDDVLLNAQVANANPTCSANQPECTHAGSGETALTVACHTCGSPGFGGDTFQGVDGVNGWTLVTSHITSTATGPHSFYTMLTSPSPTFTSQVPITLHGTPTVPLDVSILNKSISAFWLVIFGIIVALIVVGAYKLRMWGE